MTDARRNQFAEFNRKIIEEFRANGGRLGGQFEGWPIALLTTIGAKSGRRHTTPVGYVTDGDRLVVIGSNGGAPVHPQWYFNILANPKVTVEVGTETWEGSAAVAEGDERDQLFDRVVEAAPVFGEYQARVSRTLPVVILPRRTG